MNRYRSDFPIFQEIDNLHYLDTAATSQKPKVVIDSITEYYTKYNGNAGRGSHDLAIKSEELIEDARKKVAAFINARDENQVIFTKNATESLNIIAFKYFEKMLREGDEIIIPVSNHHANLVTWQEVARKTKAALKYIPVDENGDLIMDDYKKLLNQNTKLVAFSAMVNATGVINDVRAITALARSVNAATLVDVSQYIHHRRVDVEDMDADFVVFSGHKIFSAFGVGVMYGKGELLQNMPALLYGGEMIDYVEKLSTTFKDAPHRFEGGTMNAAAIHSLATSIDYIEQIGYNEFSKTIDEIYQYATSELIKIPEVDIYGLRAREKSGVIAFNVRGVHSHDTSQILNDLGVMVRSGHHCTQPLMKEMNIPSCARASFSIYNDKSDVRALVEGIHKVIDIFGV